MNIIKRNLPIFLTGIALLILFFIIIAFSQVQRGEVPGLKNLGDTEIIAAHTYIKGSPEAQFDLVMFTDFSSEEDTMYQAVLQTLYKSNSGYLSLALRHYPNSDQAFEMAKAAQVAGEQGKFWEYSTKLYEWTQEGNAEWTPETSVEVAKELNMNIRQFRNDFEKEGFAQLIKTDVEHAESLGVEKTPTFFFNNDKIQIESPKDLETYIQKEINKYAQFEKESNERNQPTRLKENGKSQPKSTIDGALSPEQIRKLAQTQEIIFTEKGFDPETAAVVKGQMVKWINKSETEIILRQFDNRYEELEEDIPIPPGGSFEFRLTEPGLWRYREVNSGDGGRIHTEDY